MSAKFAYHYGEGSGYLHLDFLGEGCQGTASLVRCVRTGRVRVRKAALYDPEDCEDNEGQWSSEHHPNSWKIQASLITQYCNGKDLRHLFHSYNDLEVMVPEAIIWRFLDQTISALHYLHRECRPAISHGDIFAGNIFVDWPQQANRRPNFFLADFGISEVHDLAPDMPAYFCDNLMGGSAFAQDYRDISALAYYLMTGDTDDRTCSKYANQTCVEESYSNELAACADDIYEYSEDVECNIHANCGPLREYIAAKARSRPRHMRLEEVRPAPVDATPLLFDSYEAIMNHFPAPPGPFKIVAIDPENLKIREVVAGPYNATKVFYTDEHGRRALMQDSTESPIRSEDRMQY